MPQVLGEGNCQYTVLNTAGTTTLNQAPPAGGPASQPGVFFGVQNIGLGTSYAVTVLDIIPAVGSVAVATNTLLNGTATAAGQLFQAGTPGIGVRYRGALVAIVSGTPGVFNALWD